MRKHRGMPSRTLRRWAVTGLLATALLCSTMAQAEAIPFKKGSTEIQADKPLRELLPDFFHDQGLEVVLSDQVKAINGSINGSFKGSYLQVWRRIASSNNLLSYWDGSAVYVYLDSERQTVYATVPLPAEQQFLAAMNSVKWPDASNKWTLETSTGLVIATGTRRFAEQVQQMAQTMSGLGQNPTTRFKFYPLKYAWASDTTMTIGNRQVTIPGVATVLRELVGQPGDNQFAGANERLLSARQRGLRGQGLAASGSQQQLPPPLGDYTTSAQDDDGLTPPNAALVPAAQQGNLQTIAGPGPSRIVADSFRNAIIVRDTADRLPMYDDLIRQLDVSPQMVEIEATIIDVDKTKARELGINWFYRNHGTTVGFSGDDTGDINKLAMVGALAGGKNGAELSWLPTLFGGGGQIGAILGNPAHFIANVDALEDDKVTHVVTHPQVITMDDAEAVIQQNQTVYVPVQGTYNSDLYNVVAGTTLRVTPHVVMEEGQPRIRLMVQIEDGNITYSAKDNNNVQYPIVSANAVNTQAVIEDGQGLLVGGLIQDTGSNAEHKIPVLGDIPLLGYLFKTVQRERDHTERLFLITPRLIALNHVSGQQTPSSSQVSVETQEQLDKEQQRKDAWWNHKSTVIQQPLPSPSPVPPQPTATTPLPATTTLPSRH